MNKYELCYMTWEEADEAIKSADYIILPLGSLEQHGPHLSLDTDIVLAKAMAIKLAQRLNGLVLPVIPYGQVWSAKDFPGTISLCPETLKALIKDICVSLHRQCVKNVILLSGHLGNLTHMKSVVRELKDEGVSLNIWYFCYPEYKKISKGIMETPMWRDSVFHAGEIETSLMLSVNPERCRMDKAVKEEPIAPADFSYRPIPWREFCESGVFGDARAATAEKGAAFMERMIEYICNIIKNGRDKGE